MLPQSVKELGIALVHGSKYQGRKDVQDGDSCFHNTAFDARSDGCAVIRQCRMHCLYLGIVAG
jgi:hypothetical protein